jgi:hypothetical protein
MKKIVAINGSPRAVGNTSFLLKSFLEGASLNEVHIDAFDSHSLDLKYCNGCLRCNLIKRCSISDDAWPDLSGKIMESDVLVFASPVYFHHLTAPVKKILDRFRSFVNVQITAENLIHTPWHEWEKDFVLLLSMGSSSDSDAKPIIELFEYMVKMLGQKNRLHVITATRLAVIRQVTYNENDLGILYKKLGLPEAYAKNDRLKNDQILKECLALGSRLTGDQNL